MALCIARYTAPVGKYAYIFHIRHLSDRDLRVRNYRPEAVAENQVSLGCIGVECPGVIHESIWLEGGHLPFSHFQQLWLPHRRESVNPIPGKPLDRQSDFPMVQDHILSIGGHKCLDVGTLQTKLSDRAYDHGTNIRRSRIFEYPQYRSIRTVCFSTHYLQHISHSEVVQSEHD